MQYAQKYQHLLRRQCTFIRRIHNTFNTFKPPVGAKTLHWLYLSVCVFGKCLYPKTDTSYMCVLSLISLYDCSNQLQCNSSDLPLTQMFAYRAGEFLATSFHRSCPTSSLHLHGATSVCGGRSQPLSGAHLLVDRGHCGGRMDRFGPGGRRWPAETAHPEPDPASGGDVGARPVVFLCGGGRQPKLLKNTAAQPYTWYEA